MLGVGRMRMNAELAVDETLDAGLETVLETIVACGDSIIYSASGQVAACVDEGIHFGMNSEIVLHGTLTKSHLRFVGALDQSVIAQ